MNFDVMEFVSHYHYQWTCKSCGHKNRQEKGWGEGGLKCYNCGLIFKPLEQMADIWPEKTNKGDISWELKKYLRKNRRMPKLKKLMREL